MGFGQSGSSLGLQRSDQPGQQQAGVGAGALDFLIQLGTSVAGGLLGTRLGVAEDFPDAPGQLQLPAGNGGGQLGMTSAACGLFRPGASVSNRARPADVVCLPNPLSGEAEFFGSLGKPLVFQRDVRMAKNIPKLIRKLGGHTQHRSKR